LALDSIFIGWPWPFVSVDATMEGWGRETCKNEEKTIFMPNQINRVEGDEANGWLLIQKAVNCLKQDSISVKTLGIVSLGIASIKYWWRHYE